MHLIKYSSKEIFKQFDLCFSQNKETLKRLKLLGVKNIYNIGNKVCYKKEVRTEVLEKNTLTFLKAKNISYSRKYILMRKILLLKIIYILKTKKF